MNPTLNYSSGLFSTLETTNLEEAQQQKMLRILDQLNLAPGSHILEIGCGWGTFCELAAKRSYKVTGITISNEQLKHAQERMRSAGVDERVDIKFCDYRELNQQFDAVVSIEMFEAVREKYWQAYYQTLYRCLKPVVKP